MLTLTLPMDKGWNSGMTYCKTRYLNAHYVLDLPL